ncbi:DUF2256 domain-containing protein [Gluconobacter roseus]|uniref:DUF2256 domain-containing protein n=1 Tax=Gluconobacter roseus NBRC 3990 TaxID=1307950 RepID=A0A4Y3M5L6_9PROT|nr:DUF2256 domain-containing protein [Gluconobacter roseus]GBR43336.1 hypothetical protein AA3990_0392 [Gluconobacter roseus NBRC 3990]GEB03925.1 DUF2256 domain-containing protein [Gluconobacter roseus NBRC 3990]GLP94378.1 DUF2256 domain-containing protein [Gluconobacter roseus NBRC 3990]
MARGKGKIAPKPAKQDLPSKVCPVCNRPFTWRKKWAKDWDQVRYCSEACRRKKDDTP